MEKLLFDLSKEGKAFKLLNGTNGAPIPRGRLSNFDFYKAARIPYSRNHDCREVSTYGGAHCTDISALFPNFDADPEDPAAYDFCFTDQMILTTLEAGTKTFFRLGETIENKNKHYTSYPPKDFKKWAVICEHVIRHYNEGWADGHHLDIEYWEIWNEPDMVIWGSESTWIGTLEQYFDLYEIAAKHLKACFPNIKVGGPASTGWEPFCGQFLEEMQKRNAPVDFLSWHNYGVTPDKMINRSKVMRDHMVRCGFEKAENILNEWNYLKNWEDQFKYSIQSVAGLKGASFALACICAAQQCPIDMLMYYDTRPSSRFNGVFDFYSLEPRKCYYSLYWYGMFYDMAKEIPAENEIENIYSLCGVSEKGKVLSTVTYFSDDDNAADKQITLDFGKTGEYEIYLVDNEHNGELVDTTTDLTFTMKVHSMLLVKEK